MAEIGLLASLIAVAGAAITSSKALFELVDQVRNAPEEVLAISRDTHSFHNVVSSVRGAIRDPAVVRILEEDCQLRDLVKELEDPLRNCAAVLAQLKPRIQAYLKPNSKGGYQISFVNVRWIFKKKDITDCRNRLEATKSTLDAALTSVVFLCSLRSAGKKAEDTYIVVPAEKDDLDAGSALLDYADSIAPHSPVLEATSELGLESESSLHGLMDLEASELVNGLPPASEVSSGETIQKSNLSDPQVEASYLGMSRWFLGLVNQGDYEATEICLEELDVHTRDSHGLTALHLAALHGHERIVWLLLSKRADPNARTTSSNGSDSDFTEGPTPLHGAATEGHLPIVQLLLDHGADIAALNSAGRTPLHLAIRYRNDDIATLLIDRGSPLMIKDLGDHLPLHEACARASARLSSEIIKKATPLGQLASMLKTPDNRGCTPLHVAIHANNRVLVILLLKHGADVDVKGPLNGATPIVSAAYDGYWQMMALLVWHGADRFIKNNDNQDAVQILRRAHPQEYECFCRILEIGPVDLGHDEVSRSVAGL